MHHRRSRIEDGRPGPIRIPRRSCMTREKRGRSSLPGRRYAIVVPPGRFWARVTRFLVKFR